MASTRELRIDTIASAGGSDVTIEPAGSSILGGTSQNKNFIGANIKKNNLTASVAPTINDDSVAGYSEGSLWIDQATGNIYSCSDSSAAAAQWVLNNATGGGGGGSLAVRSVTTSGNVLLTDDILLCDGTGGTFTLTLPTASGNDGKVFYFVKNETTLTKITIDGNGSETINGDLTTSIDTEKETLQIVSDGTNWKILNRYIPSILNDAGPISITATTTNPTTASNMEMDKLLWARYGRFIELQYFWRTDSTTPGSSVGSGDYLYGIPSGITIDTSITGYEIYTASIGGTTANDVDWRRIPGKGNGTVDGVASIQNIGAIAYSTSAIRIVYFDVNNNFRFFGSGIAFAATTQVNSGWKFIVRLPIAEWNE